MQTFKRSAIIAVSCAMVLSGCGSRLEDETPKGAYTVQTCAAFHFKVADESESRAARQLLHALSMEDPYADFSDEDSRWGVRVVIRKSPESSPTFLLLSRKGLGYDERHMEIRHMGRTVAAQDGKTRSSCDDAGDKAGFARIVSAFGEKWRLSPGTIPLRRNPLPDDSAKDRLRNDGQAIR